MPDPMLILAAMILAFAVSAAVVAILGRPWRPVAQSAAFDAAWALGIGIAFLAGCWIVGDRPHWPPRSDQDRMLLLVIPTVVVVESLLSVSTKVSQWLVWAIRGLVVAANARVLLYGTSYITDVAGPGTSEWSTSQAWLIFGGLVALEAAVWTLLILLARRAPGPSVPISLVIAIGGTGVTIMLSGYTTGGQAGLPLAAAVLGATTAAAGFSRLARGGGPTGVPFVALFSLLVVGRFFGELNSLHALILLAAPLLGWLPEMPFLRRMPGWLRATIRVVLVGVVVLAVLIDAQWKFQRDFQGPAATEPGSPSIDDYMNFGK